jgi:hypothetical protein
MEARLDRDRGWCFHFSATTFLQFLTQRGLRDRRRDTGRPLQPDPPPARGVPLKALVTSLFAKKNLNRTPSNGNFPL